MGLGENSAGGLPFGDATSLWKRYLQTRRWLQSDAFETHGSGEARFASEELLWRAMGKGELWECARVRLEDFYLMDWLPFQPGRFGSDWSWDLLFKADSLSR